MFGRFKKKKPGNGGRVMSPSYYPPRDPGIEPIDIEAVVAGQRELENRFSMALGLGKDYDSLIRPVLYRFAALVHLLPASQSHHHAGVGGMYRHCLEVATYTVEGTEGVALVSYFQGTPSNRRAREIRWRVAAGLAGLFHDLGKVVTDVKVTSQDGDVWRPLLAPLSEWFEKNGVERYYVDFKTNRHGRHEKAGVDVTQHVWSQDLREWIAEPGTDILSTLNGVIAGGEKQEKLSQLVRQADQRSVEKDLKQKPSADAAPFGISLSRHLVDGMRRLVSSEKWLVNKPGAPVWVARDGGDTYAYIIWHKASVELGGLLKKDSIPGVPKDPDTMAETLFDTQQAIPYETDDQERMYWPIKIPKMGRKTFYCLKLHSDLVFPDRLPSAVDIEIDENQGGDDVTDDVDQQESSAEEADQGSPTPETKVEPVPDAAPSQDTPDPVENANADERKSENGQIETKSAPAKGVSRNQSDGKKKGDATESGAVPATGDPDDENEFPLAGFAGNAAREDESSVEPPDDAMNELAPDAAEEKKGDGSGDAESWIRESASRTEGVADWILNVARSGSEGLVVDSGRRICLLWPESAESFDGNAGSLLGGIYDAGWLDSGSGSGKIQKKNGANVITLTPGVSSRFREISGQRSGEAARPAESKPTKAEKTPRKKAERAEADATTPPEEVTNPPAVEKQGSSGGGEEGERSRIDAAIDACLPPGQTTEIPLAKFKEWIKNSSHDVDAFSVLRRISERPDVENKQKTITRKQQVSMDYE